MSKLYFCPDLMDEEFVYPINEILDELKKSRQTEVHVFKAVREVNVDHFFCGFYNTVGTKSDSECGKDCDMYDPRNGKSGCCKHRKACYTQGKEFILHSNGVLTK